MTALRSIQAARKILDDMAETSPLTNDQAIEIAHAYARLADAEGRLKQAAAAELHAKSVDAATDVLQALQNPASKALEEARVALGALTTFLRRPRPHAAPPSSGSGLSYPPGVR